MPCHLRAVGLIFVHHARLYNGKKTYRKIKKRDEMFVLTSTMGENYMFMDRKHDTSTAYGHGSGLQLG
jgi:uncharacterized pyridoxamine 5'-phosphate oxidase family protein